MKNPILIINVPNNTSPDEKTQKAFADAIENNPIFKDFEVVIFWGCEASIYYPSKEDTK